MRSKHLAWPAVALVCGCAATTVNSGRPPFDPAEGYDERWHSAFFWGLVSLGKPLDLTAICPQGWSQVTVGRDPFTLLASVLTLFVYTPARITIVCAVPRGPVLPPVHGYAPHAPYMPSLPDGSER